MRVRSVGWERGSGGREKGLDVRGAARQHLRLKSVNAKPGEGVEGGTSMPLPCTRPRPHTPPHAPKPLQPPAPPAHLVGSGARGHGQVGFEVGGGQVEVARLAQLLARALLIRGERVVVPGQGLVGWGGWVHAWRAGQAGWHRLQSTQACGLRACWQGPASFVAVNRRSPQKEATAVLTRCTAARPCTSWPPARTAPPARVECSVWWPGWGGARQAQVQDAAGSTARNLHPKPHALNPSSPSTRIDCKL